MRRVLAVLPLTLAAVVFNPALTAQTAPQTGVQTGVQTGTQTTTQPLSATESRALMHSTLGAQTAPQHTLIPVPNPVIPPELVELVKLEADFEKSVAKGGGRAFATWFADDAVTLNNGQPPVLGKTAIANHATWDPKDYQLTWYVEGAQRGPSGDTAFTWGHYDATGKDASGKPFAFAGRYSTFWKKVNGQWKVALDESSLEPPDPNAPDAPPPCTKAQPR